MSTKMKSEAPVIAPDEAYKLAKKREALFKVFVAMDCAGRNFEAPQFDFYKDREIYFDPDTNSIHEGVQGVLDMFRPGSVEELYMFLQFSREHEVEHRLSTASEPYERAITTGVRETVRYIASVEEGKAVPLRTDRDINDYVSFTLKNKGILISFRSLFELIGHITNSVEDGRIERKRAQRSPGFANLRQFSRGRVWSTTNLEYIPYDEMNAGEKLRMLMNQLLALSTCQLYTRGFVRAYAGTPMIGLAEGMMPYIGRAVMSGSTRGIIPEISGLCVYLAPYLYEAVRMSSADAAVKHALEKMLADLIKAAMDRDPRDMGLSERDEDTDEGGFDSAFDHSDLMITLDDETYDKLMERSKKRDSGGGGIMVRREHPKEEEKPESEKEAGGSGDSSAEQDGKKETAGGGSRKSGETGSEGSGKTGDGTEEDVTSTEPGPCAGDENMPFESGEAEGGSENAGDTSGSGINVKQKAGASEDKSGTHHGRRSDASDEEADLAVQSVLDAVRKAGEAEKETVKAVMAAEREHKGHYKSTEKVVNDTYPEVTDAEVRSVMNGTGFTFREVKRTYPVDMDMPAVLDARGKALRRKMEQHFRNLKGDRARRQKSGALDSSRIHGLVMSEPDLFTRNRIGKGFDGCAYILIDNSGSMRGEKFDRACAAAAVIEEGFKALFPLKIAAFNDNYETVLHQVIKGWDERQQKNCSWNYHEHTSPGGGNADGCSIAVAAQELMKRREKKKLLVVLSDGAPTEGGSDPIELTIKSIDHARRNGIRVSGIYFAADEMALGSYADEFRAIYRKHFCCTTADKLDAELTRELIAFSQQ